MEIDVKSRNKPLVQLEGIVKYYGDRLALDNISFEVGEGEILGFLGPNGAGKTTTMRIITGYMPPTRGSVKICGIDMLENPIEAKKHIGYLPENPPVYTDMTVVSFLKFVAKLKKVPKNRTKEMIDFVLQKCGLEDVKNRLIGNLSRGYKQRVGIAQAIIHDPDIIILDEPTAGLDPKQVVEIRNLIREIAKKKTVILSTHILAEVTKICDRVIIISRGRLVFGKYLDAISEEGEKRFIISFDDKESEKKAEDVIRQLEYVKDITRKDSKIMVKVQSDGKDVRKEIAEKLFLNRIIPVELYEEKPSLEEIYLKVVSE